MVVDHWTPGTKVALLPGPTGLKLAKIEMGIILALFPLLAILVAGMAIAGEGYASSPFLTLIMVLVAGDIVSSSIASARCNRKLRAEVRAGYTTSARRFNEVDQVDVHTGYVIRVAGEPPLTRGQYDERAERIRDHIKEM
ncbi:hypothetical protein L1785_19225 [Antribacter sp. KLBMP9083]|uniref:Uncharacterized protein n=1 Tax=Antribacter soli TaxID=2910976 RepID=A0AA41UAV9_9MICO|nr:hypothetical protein [Antribacter soli]MCF4123107.1 hypothetical protein [Antribacter soli]